MKLLTFLRWNISFSSYNEGHTEKGSCRPVGAEDRGKPGTLSE